MQRLLISQLMTSAPGETRSSWRRYNHFSTNFTHFPLHSCHDYRAAATALITIELTRRSLPVKAEGMAEISRRLWERIGTPVSEWSIFCTTACICEHTYTHSHTHTHTHTHTHARTHSVTHSHTHTHTHTHIHTHTHTHTYTHTHSLSVHTFWTPILCISYTLRELLLLHLKSSTMYVVSSTTN